MIQSLLPHPDTSNPLLQTRNTLTYTTFKDPTPMRLTDANTKWPYTYPEYHPLVQIWPPKIKLAFRTTLSLMVDPEADSWADLPPHRTTERLSHKAHLVFWQTRFRRSSSNTLRPSSYIIHVYVSCSVREHRRRISWKAGGATQSDATLGSRWILFNEKYLII